ncbi:MAG: hypothetical protein U0U67_15405 [Chitinophagales bacterium]
MNRAIQSVFFWVFIFSSFYGEAENNSDDDVFQKLTSDYLAAYNKSDFASLSNDIIDQKEYNSIVNQVLKKNQTCLTDFDKNFDVSIFKRAFEKSHLYRIKSDSIVIDKITSFATCGDLDIKKISCFVYFKKNNISVPITLIVIKTEEKKYKILLDIINENYFSNAKN